MVYTELRVRSSRHHEARAASSASGTPAVSKMSETSATSWRSTQRITSAMEPPRTAAAKRSGANSFAAVAYQNSPSAVVPSALAVSHRSAAMRRAPGHAEQAPSGVHSLAGAPVDRVGSMHHTWPRPARCCRVCRRRSLLTLAASTGPSHPNMAGTARALVFPLWVGPTTTNDCAGSATTRAGGPPPAVEPKPRRPGCGRCNGRRSGPRSRRRAHRAPRDRAVGLRSGRPLWRNE